MMKYVRLIIIILVLASCKSKQRVVTTKSSSRKHTTKRPVPRTKRTVSRPVKSTPKSSTSITGATNKVIRKALSFKGTRYKYGGTTKAGMDCSGLMYTSFKTANVTLPRTSFEQSRKGSRVSKSKVRKGDLVFFKTSSRNRINHVGLVVSVDGSDVKFVHSSSSRGVMISSLKEGYWSNAFSEVRRISATSGSADTTPATSTKRTYTVKAGDTLYAIARKYTGVSANDIISFNNLKSTNLTPGMQLRIP